MAVSMVSRCVPPVVCVVCVFACVRRGGWGGMGWDLII